MKKTAVTLTTALCISAFAFAQKTPDAIAIAPYVYPENITARPDNITYLPDGSGYAVLSADRRKVVSYDIKTGKELATLFDVATAREVSLDAIEGFTLSEDASKILVWRNSSPIYRRSSSAEYYVYECRSRLLRPLSKNFSRQRSPLFSPDGRMVAFVAEDNNIHIYKWDYKTEVAVTTDGKPNEIINGVPDWTYEEEFSTSCSMTWAPDNLGFCYIKYNESDVPMYSFPLYEGTCDAMTQYALYPGSFTYKYPVAGQANSAVSVHSYDIETRKTKDITLSGAEVEYIPRIKYTPSSDMLVVATLNRDQNNLHFFAVNPKSTVAKTVYHEESKTWIEPMTYENFSLEPDGFVVLSSRSGYNHLYKYSYNGSLIKQLTSGDFDVTDYYGGDVKGNHYYQAALPTPIHRTVCRTDAKGTTTTISRPEGMSSASFSPAADYCVINYSNTVTPPVYTLCTSQGKQIRVLEDNASFAARYKS
ncbi:MAG: DPP IV N-terminal domain-containing protein, partial [Muribaculaceae bacterium]|nr:DPP IV N-terminal domain-containing protein [Muribaculaceae bacterium]